MLVCPRSKFWGSNKCQKTRSRQLFEKIPRITLTTPTLRLVKGKPPPEFGGDLECVSQEGLRKLEQDRYCFGFASRGGFHAEQDAT